MYKLGYQRGRQRTEQEAAAMMRRQSYTERWNSVFLTLLPIAMQASGWSMSGEPVSTSEQRISLARSWTNKAITEMKS